ncbi:MAG: phosphoribosylformylglycinamidine cyclo-ligase [Deltaproteobacteria bacterium]|nr:phosphoribosylformylglycinamidine cyclo-ligase [Deltaproteobacteria bacterium]MBI3296050.1 phosphoribosylformylglycinamidine cyclo-ligase [Deltaproteobacteria bacterium]
MTTYKDSGVDQDRADETLSQFAAFQKSRPRDPNVITGIGPYASCYALNDILKGMTAPVLATSCDGVGTKCLLALEWGQLDGLGQDLVAMNVNDIVCVGAKPILFLDYYACGKLQGAQLTTLLKSIQAGCELAGCSLVGGETAEMPGLYKENDFDLAGFAIGMVDRGRIIGAERVKSGARLIALASSGFHSNGYSLVRRFVEKEVLKPNAVAIGGRTWSEVLLAPTKIYTKTVGSCLGDLQAAAHITGGGLFGNLERVIPSGHSAVVESSNWPMPELFLWAQKAAGVTTHDLLNTFNCGVGMILVVAPEKSESVMKSLNGQGEKAWDIGSVKTTIKGAEPKVEWV